MSKLKKEELLKYFDDMCLFLANHHWTKRDERAVAIREMIQKKLGVTEEFVEKWKKHSMESGIKSAMQAEYNIRQMLKEAGVEVMKK